MLNLSVRRRQGDFHLEAGKTLSASGSLTLTTTGSLTNDGSFEAGNNLTLQAAYAHVFFDSAPISSATQTSFGTSVLAGKYANSADTASLGVKIRF